jgi:hypothetical protein
MPATSSGSEACVGAAAKKRVKFARRGERAWKELKAALRAARTRYRSAERTVARMKAQRGELYRKT